MYLRGRHYLLIDILLTIVSFYLSFLIRYDTAAFARAYDRYALFTLVLLAIRLPIYFGLGLYRRLWRYASVRELVQIFFAVSLGSVVALVLSFWLSSPLGLHWFQARGFPRSIIAIDWLLTLFAIGGVRFLPRLFNEGSWGRPGELAIGRPVRKSVLIVGAGDAGAMLAHEILRSGRANLTPVGFLDDDPQKLHHRIHGLPVLGRREDLRRVTNRYPVEEVIIAMPTAPGKVVRETLGMCLDVGIPARTVPGIYELLDGSVSVQKLRDVKLDDLLRRAPRSNGLSHSGAYLTGRRVLVTGAGGSIGAELCRQIAYYRPARLILLGHGENSIFEVHNELARTYPTARLTPAIADIRDGPRLNAVFAQHRPEVVFHAAAHKHVPLMEVNPVEAVTNNVLGTARVVEAVEAHGVGRFVLVSTDKAVRPISMMGATKRLAELLVVEAARRTGGRYVAVRFGNVLGSRGSVVPVFQKQIAAGGPITVTDADMRRYFMTIPEAVHLIIQAGSLGQGGEVFVLDMGEPVRIADLARELIRLSGLEVGRDIDLVFTGIRPGEKLEEELFFPEEIRELTPDEAMFVARNPSPPAVDLWSRLPDLEAAAKCEDRAAIVHTLQQILPEFEATHGPAPVY